MQRMLVGLVLFLTVAVGVLGVTVYNLSTETDARPGRQASGRTAAEGVDPVRVETLERQLARLRDEIKTLRADAAKTGPAPVTAAPARDRADIPQLGAPDGTDPLAADGRTRDAEGAFLISEEDEEYFQALQKRVQWRQRIDGMTRSVMRRVDRLAARGEINPVTEDVRPKVEEMVRKYVVAGDQLLAKYVRNPTEEVKALDREQRRTVLGDERKQMVEQARVELVPLLGEEDAAKVAEQSLASPWGVRRQGESLGFGGRNSRVGRRKRDGGR